jgi:hypothetical protein
MKYHNEIRTHLSLEKDAPVSRAVKLPGPFFAARSWAGCTTNMFGFDLRQAQPSSQYQKAADSAAIQPTCALGVRKF